MQISLLRLNEIGCHTLATVLVVSVKLVAVCHGGGEARL